MLKIAFLKKSEIEEIVNKTLTIKDSHSELIYNEELCDEQVLIKNGGLVCDTLEMEDVISIIEALHNVIIKSYDVYEISEYGEGFAFNLA